MNFIYPLVTVYNPNAVQMQFFQLSPPALMQNVYETPNFYSSFSQLQEQNTFILASNFTTQESLAGGTTPQTPKKKKTVIKVFYELFQKN